MRPKVGRLMHGRRPARGTLATRQTAQRVAVGLKVGVGGVHIRRIEVEVVGIAAIVRRRRPIVPVATEIVDTRVIGVVVATAHERREAKKNLLCNPPEP